MTTASSTLLGRPVWYELMTTDTAAAEKFYKNVIGWASAPFGRVVLPGTGRTSSFVRDPTIFSQGTDPELALVRLSARRRPRRAARP